MSKSRNNSISIKGSACLIADFFNYGVNDILYQRGIYPPEMFTRSVWNGQTMMVLADQHIKAYIQTVAQQIKEFVSNQSLQKFVLVIKNVDSSEVIERWQFDISGDSTNSTDSTDDGQITQKEIQSMIRQITSSLGFMPVIDDTCSFDILLYTNAEQAMPLTWETCGPDVLTNSENLRLSAFNTHSHKVEGMVCYKT